MSGLQDKLKLSMWKRKFAQRMKTPEKQPAVALLARGMEQGGVEQVMLDLYRGYRQRGFRVYLVSETWVIDAVKDKIASPEDIYVFDGSLDNLIHFLWRRDIRTVHYHYNVFGMEEMEKLGVKTIYTMHNVYTWMDSAQIRAYARHLLHAGCVVPVASSVRQYFEQRAQCPGIRYRVINNGVNFSDLDSTEGTLPVTRASLQIPEKSVTICQIGSFYHAKHQIGMLGVAEKLVEKYPQVQILFLGGRGDMTYRSAFMAELEQCRVRDHVHVIPFFDHRYMGRFLRAVVDIFALPSLHEGNPLTALEAMYCARPMVLTPTGLYQELEKDAACLVAESAWTDLISTSDDEIKFDLSLRKHARNEDSLVSCFSEIIEHLDEYRQKAEACREKAQAYSIERMVDEYVELIRSA